MLFEEIKVGNSAEIDILVKGIQNNIAKTGQPFQTMICSDTGGNMMKVQNFNNLLNTKDIKYPFVCLASIKCDLYYEAKTYAATELKKSVKKISDFRPKSIVNPKKVWGEIIQYIKKIDDAFLCNITCTVLKKHQKEFMIMPLNLNSFNRSNGIMEATLKLIKLADGVCNELDYLDRDLMIAAASVFYIGQVLATNSQFDYTREEILLGSGILSYEEIVKAEADMKANYPDSDSEKLIYLKHLIIAREKGHYAAIPESITLQYLDNILQETDECHSILNILGDGGYVDKRYTNNKTRFFKIPKGEDNGKSE